ncbi:hypothetical protein NQZ79_g5678 [Umbelopsis isabellina]|nr:hypothetical protein NQZ79_g5678 [Umbelopsis isabellina]
MYNSHIARVKNVDDSLWNAFLGRRGTDKAPTKNGTTAGLAKWRTLEQSTTAMDINGSPNGMYTTQSASEVELQTSNTHAEASEHQTDNVEEQSSSSSNATNVGTAANIVAVFVSRFDIHSGNVIEWQYPSDVDLTGVEYQSICSGLHSISQDTIYFKKGNNFGVSAFENKAMLENTEERGARMMAVGCLVAPTPDTGSCGLSEASDTTTSETTEIESTSNERTLPNFASLSSIDTSKMHRHASISFGPLSPSVSSLAHSMNSERSAIFTVNHQLYSVVRHPAGTDAKSMEYLQVEESHPAHSFPEFVRAMGPNLFILWKAAILKKRILLLTSSPVEKACHFELVYNICLLASLPRTHNLTLTLEGKNKLQPLFCVGINDIEQLEKLEGGYVACTPDKIFQQKHHLFDILVTLPDTPEDEAGPGMMLDGAGVSYNLPKLAHSPSLRIQSVDFGSTGNLRNMRYTQANFLQYRILRIMIKSRMNNTDNRRLSGSTTFSDLFSEPDDGYDYKLADLLDRNSQSESLGDTLGKFLLGGWFWWYGRDEGRSTSRFQSWQDAFVGHKRRTRREDHLNREERTRLLFGGSTLQEDEGDAPVITDSNIMATLSGQSPSISIDDDAGAPNSEVVSDRRQWLQIELIRFFHTLSLQVLILLQSKLKEQEDEEDIILQRHDIDELGMAGDEEYVIEMAQLYFGKSIQVANRRYCRDCCYCLQQQPLRI